jgi:putative hydrolase of the HAD superfamily
VKGNNVNQKSPDSPEIKAIIFDFGEVLNAPLDLEAIKAHRAQIAKKLNLTPDGLWTYLFEGEPSRQWMTGKLSWDQFWAAVLAPRGVSDPEEVQSISDSVFAGTEKLNPDMVSLLEELKGRYKLAILSNASWTEEEMVAMLHDERELPEGLVDTVVTSTSVGVTKPDPRIYQVALKRLGVRPEETIFTDDLPSFTAEAARLGMHTHNFRTPAAFRKFLNQMGVSVKDPTQPSR